MAEDLFEKGLRELMNELRGLPGNIEQNSLKKALEEMAVMFAAEAANNAPVSDEPRTTKVGGNWRTLLPGYLRNSIKAGKARARRGVVGVGITGAYYARWVEKGHTIAIGRGKRKKEVGHVPANPFIQRAFDSTKQWALDVGRRILVEEIDKRIKRLNRKVNGG